MLRSRILANLKLLRLDEIQSDLDRFPLDRILWIQRRNAFLSLLHLKKGELHKAYSIAEQELAAERVIVDAKAIFKAVLLICSVELGYRPGNIEFTEREIHVLTANKLEELIVEIP